MSGETSLTVVGNLVADPELRFTQTGVPVANFRVASTPRVYDKTRAEWVDGEALFLSCTIWRDAAQNVAETLRKGMRVLVHGDLRARQYEDREGVKRTSFEVEVVEVGPSIRYAIATVSKRVSDSRHSAPASVAAAS